jgi:hypothetical protein
MPFVEVLQILSHSLGGMIPYVSSGEVDEFAIDYRNTPCGVLTESIPPGSFGDGTLILMRTPRVVIRVNDTGSLNEWYSFKGRSPSSSLHP